jgi:hypothetical protein
VAASAGGANEVLRVRVVVAPPLLPGAGRQRRPTVRGREHHRRAPAAPVRDAPVARHRRRQRQERGAGATGDAEPGGGGVVPVVVTAGPGRRQLLGGEVQRHGRRGLRRLGDLRLRHHGAAAEPRVARAAEHGDHLLELGHRHVRHLPAVHLLLLLLHRLVVLKLRWRGGAVALAGAGAGQLRDEVLHPAQTRCGSLLDGRLLVRASVPAHQVQGNHPPQTPPELWSGQAVTGGGEEEGRMKNKWVRLYEASEPGI